MATTELYTYCHTPSLHVALPIAILLNAGVKGLVVENGRVTGVEVEVEGETRKVLAREGVLINAGGFSHNLEMRQKYQQSPIGTDWTNANPDRKSTRLNSSH